MMRSAFVGTLVLASVCAGRAVARPVTEVHYVMGTYFRITADHADESVARTALRRCFADARRFDERFSRFDPRSELTQLNDSRATAPAVTISAELSALLQRALRLQAATAGAFDVTVGALTELWRTASVWPTAARIEAIRRSGGQGAVSLHGTTLLRRPGTMIDLDGIAKGWAVDRCVADLRAAGIKRAFLSFGESSLYALGAPRRSTAWSVELRSLDPDRALGTLTLRDEAVSVSTVFGHEREVGAQRVGHIVDPRTGRPLTTPTLAVAVADSATDAEAFSKALLIDGTLTLQRHRDDPGWPAISGGLLVRPGLVRRIGHLRFSRFQPARPIPVSAEALR